jgi:hypothetical protein
MHQQQKGRILLKKIRVQNRYLVLSFVCLVLGYLLAYSYQLTQKENESKTNKLSDKQWEKTIALRNQLNDQEEMNRKLEKETGAIKGNARQL